MRLQLDHVVVAVRDLNSATDRFHTVFGLEFGPPQRPFPGAVNRIARTPVGFLELIAVEDPGLLRSSPLGTAVLKFLEAGEGVFGAALETPDIQAAVDYCRSNGGPISDPTRQVLPMGLGFWAAFLSFKDPWLIQYDWTPQTFGRPHQVTPSPGGRIRLTHVGLLTHDCDHTALQYSRYFGLTPAPAREIPELRARYVTLPLVQGELRLWSPIGPGPMTDLLEMRGEGFATWGLAVEEPSMSCALAREAGLAPREIGTEQWVLMPEDAYGGFVFVEPIRG